jgi:hypothetical protein
VELLKIKIKKNGFEDSFFVIAVVFAMCIFILVMAYAFREIIWHLLRFPLFQLDQ